MHIKSKFASWIGGLREQASSLHPRARITGVVDFFHPILDVVGERVGCWRLPRERDDDYAFRLGAHITSMKTGINEWTAAGGWAGDTEGRSSPYVRLGFMSRQ